MPPSRILLPAYSLLCGPSDPSGLSNRSIRNPLPNNAMYLHLQQRRYRRLLPRICSKKVSVPRVLRKSFLLSDVLPSPDNNRRPDAYCQLHQPRDLLRRRPIPHPTYVLQAMLCSEEG